jgi:hypothetical protein
MFDRHLNDILRQKLHTLYNLISTVSLTTSEDIYIWRWSTNSLYSTKTCYSWLEFRGGGGVISTPYNSIWSAYISQNIKKICG